MRSDKESDIATDGWCEVNFVDGQCLGTISGGALSSTQPDIVANQMKKDPQFPFNAVLVL